MESWDDTDFRPLHRSTVLFNIPQVGLGTVRCEGLNSYLIRLAGEHSVNVRDLIRNVMIPEDAALMATQKPGFNHRAASTINGLGPYAEAFASTLNRLTGREDL